MTIIGSHLTAIVADRAHCVFQFFFIIYNNFLLNFDFACCCSYITRIKHSSVWAGFRQRGICFRSFINAQGRKFLGMHKSFCSDFCHIIVKYKLRQL